MNEFELIDLVLSTLGETVSGDGVVLGPGDDAAAVRIPPGNLLVSSIDSLLAGVHFPADADAELVGYRALMVSLSDLAAMGATASHVLVSLTIDNANADWVRNLSLGMRAAALATGVKIVGGNFSRGATALHVSVHGYAPEATLLRRDTASVGDGIYVTGMLGGAAAALARGNMNRAAAQLDALALRYFKPEARLEAGVRLRGHASGAIDVSDGLLQDLEHLCHASGVMASIRSDLIPLFPGAGLEQALSGGDDYELLFTAATPPPELDVQVTRIGEIREGAGILLDGAPAAAAGYQHF